MAASSHPLSASTAGGDHAATAGGPGRRLVLTAGLGLVATAAGLTAGAPRAVAAAAAITGTKVRNLTGPAETGRFAAPWTDLGIPVRCPDGTMLFICGDTFDGGGVGGPDWRAPVGLRARHPDLNALVIDDSVGGSHAVGLVPESHENNTTAIPSDVFTVGDTMYMHLMRGVLYRTHHSDFWRSTDNGQTWQYLCQWPGDQYGGQFQQKTYAVADDGYCYVLSSVFNRDVASDLLLHRVRQDQLGDPAAYQPWGYANGAWGWGNYPTTITARRRFGEICFRAMGGKYALTWLNMEPLDIRAQVFALPTSDLFATPEQPLIVPTTPGNESGNAVANPYGGFIVPGSTFGDFHLAVSQWYDDQNYRVMQYRINGLAA
ncbi:DUF4185 domain-containing protein [Streptomyces malaysiensis]|uniref:DUF4185 domain-containing protein n=1 Tax=Streptomyces malaysiensis TaxID=92644 RepID=UPI0009A1878E|nr:DUF4185 domain-containing protein [Streptomyces autolyticus]